jgi:hypothetical protein
MGRIKCVKMQCTVCGNSGSCQLFLNRKGLIKYARVRHYSHTDKESHKPQFTYCKIEDLQALKTLLLNKGISLSTDRANSGQTGQKSNAQIHDPKLKVLNPNTSVEPPLGFEPRTFSLQG